MKQILVALLLGSMFSVTGQEAEIQKAQENLKAGKSKEAIRYLREAQNSIVGKIVSDMSSALPADVGEFKMENNERSPESRSLQFQKQYRKPSGEDLPMNEKAEGSEGTDSPEDMGMVDPYGMESMEVYVSDNLSEGSNVFMMHSLSGEGGMGEGEALMIGENKAILNDSESWKALEIVSTGVFIRITGQGLKDSKPMLDLANAIDFDKLNKALGN